jgi:hypothetical protein
MQGYEVYIDSSIKTGAIINQTYKPLEFVIQKLSPAQQRYSMTKQELLAIEKTLKEFLGSTTH